MPSPLLRGLLRGLLFSLALGTTAKADYQAGLNAYSNGEYRTAMKEWRAVTDNPAGSIPTIFAEAHYAIAMLYWQGKGVKQDFTRAREWLEKAAKLNHSGAQAKLGYLYTDGNAVPQNHDIAFEWYTKAARAGNVDGQYNLGISYLYGWGTEPDMTMAAQYLAAASAQGDEAAEEALVQVLADLKVTQPEAEIAVFARDNNAVEGAASATIVLPDKTIAAEAAPTERPNAVPKLRDSSWIWAQDPDRYVIQVIALSDLARLEALIEDFADLQPFATFTVERSGKSLYVLLQGDYPDVDAARRARDYFPRAIQKTDQLWIRQFGMVQDQIGN